MVLVVPKKVLITVKGFPPRSGLTVKGFLAAQRPILKGFGGVWERGRAAAPTQHFRAPARSAGALKTQKLTFCLGGISSVLLAERMAN